MATPDINTSWEKIRRNVKESEILIGQKKYNLSMVKARQALEGIVYSLCDKAAIVEPDLASSIDALYSGRWISKTSCEHYHKIRMLGNKAVHEGSDDAYEANQAYHLISQEAYTYSHEYNNNRKNRQASSASPAPTKRRPPSGSSGNRSRKRRKQSGVVFTSYDVARLVFFSLVVVLIIVVVALFNKKEKSPEPEETTPSVIASQEEPTLPETTSAPETMAPTTASPVYKTSDNLNVRSQPSTDGEKIDTLPVGTVVEYVGDYDSEWSIIIYNNEEAYVASQYLVQD